MVDNGLFISASKITLDLIADLNKKQSYTFLIPTRFISSECGQAAYLLNEYFNQGRNVKDRICYRTFFCNSRFEAVQGSLKIARHKAAKKSGYVLL